MSEINESTINIKDNSNNISMIKGNEYYFILGADCYLGKYIKEDKFIENNYILSFRENEFSLPKDKIFSTKEQCNEYMETNYKNKGYPYSLLSFHE